MPQKRKHDANTSERIGRIAENKTEENKNFNGFFIT